MEKESSILLNVLGNEKFNKNPMNSTRKFVSSNPIKASETKSEKPQIIEDLGSINSGPDDEDGYLTILSK